MVEVTGGRLKVIVIYIPTNKIPGISALPRDPDLPAVRDPKQILICRRNKPYAAAGFLHMPFQPWAVVAVAINVVIVDPAVDSQKVAVILCVGTKAVISEKI